MFVRTEDLTYVRIYLLAFGDDRFAPDHQLVAWGEVRLSYPKVLGCCQGFFNGTTSSNQILRAMAVLLPSVIYRNPAKVSTSLSLSFLYA